MQALNPDISIIIPFYNGAETIGRLLDSIPEQENIEVLVIDDQSQPEELTWQNNYSERKNLHLHHLQEKGYAGGARNQGLALATGNYVMFADSDDYFTAESFALFQKYVEKDADDLVIFNMDAFLEGSNKPSQRMAYHNKIVNYPIPKAALLAVSPCAKLIKRLLLSDHGISFSTTSVANDVYFSTHVATMANNIQVVPEVVYQVSDRPGSLTKVIDCTRAIERLSEQIKAISLIKKTRPKLYNWYILRYSNVMKYRSYLSQADCEDYKEMLDEYENMLGAKVVMVASIYHKLKKIFS